MSAILEARGLSAGYGPTRVLSDVDLEVHEGGITAVLGRNGVGKTTLMKALVGLLPALSGKVVLRGQDVTAKGADHRARSGIGLVPQGREIFPRLTVEENLQVALDARGDRKGIPWDRIV